ncbi:MAG: M36 family metallopeptidase, partial [Thermoanaerobaculia bacterium]
MHKPLVVRSMRAVLACLLALLSLQTFAAVAPDRPAGKGAPLAMLDARVNDGQAYRNALAPRAAAALNGQNAAQSHSAAIAQAVRDAQSAMPGLETSISNLTGGPRLVRNARGTLTGQARGVSSESIVRGFLRARGSIYGLTELDQTDLVVLGDSAGGASGLRMLRMEQRVGGLPVFQSETRFTLDRDGRLVQSVGQFIPRARTQAVGLDASKHMTPSAAMVSLLASLDQTAAAAAFAVTAEADGRLTLSEDADYVAGPITAQKMLFPLAPGLLVPAWSLVVFTDGAEDWYALVDAETGDVLWRKNIRNYASTHDARFRVYVQADGVTPADSPAPASPNAAVPGAGTQFTEIAPTIVSMFTAQNLTASPNGWIDDCPGGVCTANETQTLGNNTLTCIDRSAPNNVCDTDVAGVLDGNGRPTGNPDANTRDRDFLGTAVRDFVTNYLPAPQGGDPEAGQTATGVGASGTNALDQFRRGSVTHLFYVTNWFHDRMFTLGFDEASGNFQQTNFSGMGLGGDRVNGDAQDNGGTNNANFSTPPDGTSGRMQMYRFTGPTIDRDGGLDSEIVIHELAHGLSNRLVGNAAGLNWSQARGLGEGWSDFYALALLNNTNADDPNARYAAGSYATYKLGGLLDNYVYAIRRFPYSTDNAVNPMTWADVDDVTNSMAGGIPVSPLNFNGNGGMEVHNSGELWALSLWEVRARVIADPAGANGDVPTGNQTILQFVTDAMKLTPNDPTFVEARDALFDADCATNACANEQWIWDGFADRGLGYGAATPYNVAFGYTASHLGVLESFSVPFLDVVDPLTDVAIDDSASNNNGAIDPGEAIAMTVTLTNPWRAASKAVAAGATATLTTATAGVTIFDNASTYGAIAPQGNGAGDSFVFTVDPAQLCGSSIEFTLTTTSSLGVAATTFSIRVGTRNGTDPLVTYTRDTAPDLAIPDGQP